MSAFRAPRLPEVSHILRTQERPALRGYRVDAARPIDARVVPLITAWFADVAGLSDGDTAEAHPVETGETPD